MRTYAYQSDGLIVRGRTAWQHREHARAAAAGTSTVAAPSGGSQHPMEQPQIEQRGDVPVHGNEVHGRPAAAQLAVQLARAEGARMALDEVEEGAAAAGHPPAAPPQGRLRAEGERRRH